MKTRTELIKEEIKNLEYLLSEEKKEKVGTKICANCKCYYKGDFENCSGLGNCSIWGVINEYNSCNDFEFKQA